MKKPLLIFQMSVFEDLNNKTGLFFSSEIENYQSQFVQFCLPIHKSIRRTDELIVYLENFEIQMPFSFGNNIIVLSAKMNFPYIEFNFLEQLRINQSLKFEIQLQDRAVRQNRTKKIKREEQPSKRISRTAILLASSIFPKLNYFGSWKGIDKNITQFILINIPSVEDLNNLYSINNLIPIGATLNFGIKDFNIENIDINFNNGYN